MTDAPQNPQHIPDDAETRLIICRTMEQMFQQSQTMTNLLLNLQARMAGVEAVTPIVDQNQADANTARQVGAQKEIISHMYDRAQQYTAVVIAGAFAAFFATYSVVSARMPDKLVALSALLMTASVTVFVFHEIFSITWISYKVMRGNLEAATESSKWMRILWGIAMFVTIGCATPAIVLAVLSCWHHLTL